MGLRFRRSVRFGPARINLSKSGVSGSLGVPGARVGRSRRGSYVSLALLGTGIRWMKYFKKRRR